MTCVLVSFSVHLVELQGTKELFAMKAMDKSVMLNRNKVVVLQKHTKCMSILIILDYLSSNFTI